MATHSSTLAWRIPWTEEPGRQLDTQACIHTHTHTFTPIRPVSCLSLHSDSPFPALFTLLFLLTCSHSVSHVHKLLSFPYTLALSEALHKVTSFYFGSICSFLSLNSLSRC